MSEVGRTDKDGTEHRPDGSKIATEDDPSGETETDAMKRKQSQLPNGGRSPDYDEPDPDELTAPSPPTGA